MSEFARLFKKYRLRAEFETFAAFGDALSEKGYYYEDSIFSHWQKGTRVPTNRELLLKIIEIFIERDAITNVDEANELFASADLGYMTKKEKENLHFKKLTHVPFQVPHESPDFTGRDEIIEKIRNEAKNGKTIFICGQPGVGKTALAIKLGHLLREDFPDGVLWYRLDNAKIEDIFIAIAHLLGEKLPKNKNIEIVASFIRSILARKRILLILDNVETKSNIHLLLPHPTSSSLIILSKQKDIYLPANTLFVSLQSFTEGEVLHLFRNIFDKSYVRKHKTAILKLAQEGGYLPLAVHLFASQLKQSSQMPEEFITTVKREQLSLQNIRYENKNLYLAFNVTYKHLSKEAQAVFLSLGVFEGKDFSIEAIAYMNGLTLERAKKILDELYNASLIETSLNNKFRIHQVIKKFISERLYLPSLSKILKITVLLFAAFTIFWIILNTQKSSWESHRIFSATYFTVPLWGSFLGFSITKKWGGFKSIVGKTISFFSLGLLFQVVGQISYTIYTAILHIEIPYPSLGDIGYFGSMIFYLFAVFNLVKIFGVKLDKSFLASHVFSIILSIIFLICCYLFLLQNYVFDWSKPLKIFLDFAYPLGDGIYTVLALLLYFEMKKTRKNIMKNIILFFVSALFMMFLSDSVFIYQANLNVWQVGQFNDYMYLFAYLLMTLAIFKFNAGLSKVLID